MGFRTQKGDKMENQIFAYMRISTNKQTQKTDRQRKTILDYAAANHITIPADNFYEDVITGATNAENRPNYSRMRGKMRGGDILIVSDVDRLGRDADNVIMEIKELKRQGIRVIALDIPFMNDWKKMNDDSLSEMIIDIFVSLRAHIAQQEKEKNHARVMQGLDTARAKGIKLGRPRAKVPDGFIKEYHNFKEGKYGSITFVQFAKMNGLARSTAYKYIRILGK